MVFTPDTDLLALLQQGIADLRPRRLGGDRPEASVLVALTDNCRDPQVVLTLRAHNLTAHGGEVAFPGGKRDPGDASLQDTALRETQEELGIAPAQVRVLAPLGQVVSKNGLLVAPFLGLVPENSRFCPNPGEIARVFRVPLRFFLEDCRERTDFLTFARQSLYVPAYRYEGHLIWGLTAYVLVELLNLGLGAKIPLRPRPEVRALEADT
ncbi:CoA pyrophosphatase [Motiliproteus sp. SC1-56]|uniref:NUDIX hydrolase n=1 Tax=Motiliproteus sp. SC1-56 TaxID=2799565 RepID=UPI001F5C61E9|nr:CoA pyrophosphatase [Motiliproteus sp. SC1-56]